VGGGGVSTTKQSGLGDQFAFGGYLIGGDVQALTIASPIAMLDVTDITQSAHQRLPGLRDGSIEITTYLDPAAGAAHAALSPLTRSDVIETYFRGQGLGNPACCLQALQLDYDPTRGNDGSLTQKVTSQGDGYGMEWGLQVTPGFRTDTAATNGTSLNNSASTAWGGQAYLQAVALTGTNVTVTVQHAPDNATWLTLLAFTQLSSGNSNLPPSAQRAATFTGPFTATLASPAVFTAAGSSFANGTPVALAASGVVGTALPGGFTSGTTYYVVSASGSTFELSATSGGSAINSSSAGSGNVTCVVDQYVRVITAGTFTSFQFAVILNRNQIANVSF
jgi:hypothetical protein